MDLKSTKRDVDFIGDYKKNGHFDNRRKQLLGNFTPMEQEIAPLIKELVLIMIQMDPSIVNKNNTRLSAIVQTRLLQKSAINGNTPLTNGKTNPLVDRENEIVANIKSIINTFVRGEVTDNESLLEIILEQLVHQ